MLTFFLASVQVKGKENTMRWFLSSKNVAFKYIKSFALPIFPIEYNYQKAFILWYYVYIVIARLMN